MMFAILLLGIVALTAAQELAAITPPKGQPLNAIPQLGLGTFTLTVSKENTTNVIAGAMEMGYRHFDAAAVYTNENWVGVGIAEGLKRTGLKREDIWVTTKLWNDRHADQTEQGLKESLERLGLTYIDLFLMHFPVDQTKRPYSFDHVATWKSMEKLVRPNGPVRFIGVSNFSPVQMKELLAMATIKPKVHQFELHPYLQQSDWVDYHAKNNITVTAYAPLGNTSPYYRGASSRNPSKPPLLLENPVVLDIAKARGCTAAQVSLAWNMKRRVSVIPKTGRLSRQKENLDALEKCKLTDEDSKKIEAMSTKWAGRFNNPCKLMGMPCFAGLFGANSGYDSVTSKNALG